MNVVINKTRRRIAVLGSGKGSNLAPIAQACRDGRVNADIELVLSDMEESGILARARELGLRAEFIAPGGFRTKLEERAEQEYIGRLKEERIDLVVLAGFMRVLKGEFLATFEHRVVNIHPSLLPSFPGLQGWKQALDYGVKITGCTVHLVDRGVDTGPIVAQEAVPVLQGDTAESLHARIQQAEYRLYPAALELICNQKMTISGRHTSFSAE